MAGAQRRIRAPRGVAGHMEFPKETGRFLGNYNDYAPTDALNYKNAEKYYFT
jgi:hypothetical protein